MLPETRGGSFQQTGGSADSAPGAGSSAARAAGIEFAHPVVGSIIGVGVANALLHGRSGTSGVDWSKAKEVGEALLVSSLFGFALAAVLLLLLKSIVRIPALYAEPEGDHPPPWWICGILILTCTLVSFFHGSNDGQKGMGLIMLILIGTVPTAYALNRAMPESEMRTFATTSQAASAVINQKATGLNVLGNPRPAVTAYVASQEINEGTFPWLAILVRDISNQVTKYGSLAKLPANFVGNTRNDMYLVLEAIRFLMKDKASELSEDDLKTLKAYKLSLDQATKFMALSAGTSATRTASAILIWCWHADGRTASAESLALISPRSTATLGPRMSGASLAGTRRTN